ncbi:hypothetical protein GCM10010412_100960 [Nonomuraea recticatena]|uniref:Cysteine-rich small domain-containing protein n=1 Tax=Nonomuraea recticatena TaxID=46178 RepID=A0ABN3TGM2_9ACTN
MLIPCPFPNCECPHLGCEDGWINRVGSDGSDFVQPCRGCRPEVAAHLRMAPGSGAQVRAGLRHLPRPSRTPEKSKKSRRSA